MKKFMFFWASTVLMFGMSAHAGVLVLKNGDRISGDITKIWDNEVFIEPSYADEFTIDLDQVVSIESDKNFEFNRYGEKILLAKFMGRDEEGRQLVQIDGEEVTVRLMNIEEINEQEEFFDWALNSDFNANLESGNTEKEEFSIRLNTYLKYGDQKHYLDALFEDEENDKVTTKDREKYTYNFNYDLGDLNSPWFAGFFGSYETDDIKGLKYRYSGVPTIGYTVWDSAKHHLDFQAGYGIEDEETIDEFGGNDTDGGGLFLASSRFRWDFGSPDLEYYLKLSFTKQSYGRRNSVTAMDTGLKFEITDLLYFSLSSLIDYESEPADGADNEDIQVLIGLGLEFEK